MTNLALIVDQIKNEISVDATGKGKASIRAVARLMDVADSSLVRAFETAALSPSGLAEMLIDNGFDGAAQNSWSQTGIPDLAIAVIAKYYAYKAGRYCKKQAELVDTAFTGIGVRSWIQQQLGWKGQEFKPTNKTTQPQSNPLALCQDANFLIDMIFEGTSIHPNLKAGYKANEFAKLHPALAPSCENTKSLLGIVVEEKLVRPGKLAELYEAKTGIKLSAQKMNKLLEDKGLQIKNNTGNPSWLPTEEGEQYSQLILDTAKGHNKTVQSLQWYPSVIEVI